MEECLESLEMERERPDDDTLIALVRLQLVSHEAHAHLVEDVANHANNEDDKTPSFVYRKGLLNRLKTVRESISNRAAANCE